MRKIIYTRSEGGLSVVHPVRNTVGETLTTDAEIEQRAWDKLPADAITPQWVDASVVPPDRTFRNAWVAGPGTINHDMPKAREIHRQHLREIREPKFGPIERAQRTALSQGDTVEAARLEAQLQALRDATNAPAIDSAATPAALKAVIPAALR